MKHGWAELELPGPLCSAARVAGALSAVPAYAIPATVLDTTATLPATTQPRTRPGRCLFSALVLVMRFNKSPPRKRALQAANAAAPAVGSGGAATQSSEPSARITLCRHTCTFCSQPSDRRVPHVLRTSPDDVPNDRTYGAPRASGRPAGPQAPGAGDGKRRPAPAAPRLRFTCRRRTGAGSTPRTGPSRGIGSGSAAACAHHAGPPPHRKPGRVVRDLPLIRSRRGRTLVTGSACAAVRRRLKATACRRWR